MMKLSSKPSVWLGLTLSILLVLLVRQQRKIPPVTHVGKIWINKADDGFTVSFQLVGAQGASVPGNGMLHIQIVQKLYPFSDEAGATFKRDYQFSVSDFKEEVVGKGKHSTRYYTATTGKIAYNDFKPPSEKGITCRLSFLFLETGKYEDFEPFVKTQIIVI